MSRPVYRVRRTLLEDFRRVVHTEWGNEAELVARIQGNPPAPNENMQIGTAFHECLRYPAETRRQEKWGGKPHLVNQAAGLPYLFGAAEIDQCHKHLGPGLWEVPAYLTTEAGGLRVELEGTADHLHGLRIQDNKCKFSTADAKDYEGSLQWRVYLLLHEAVEFRYNLFDMRGPNKSGIVYVDQIDSFSFRPYVGMEADVMGWLGSFMEWAGDRGLLPFLDRRRLTAAGSGVA